MQDTLHTLERWLEQNYPIAFDSLQDGLSDAEIDEVFKDWPLKLPQEVRALYRWKNGLEDDLLQLLPGMTFLSLEEAHALAGMLWQVSEEQAKKGGEAFFPQALFPIFADDKRDGMLLIQGFEQDSPTTPAQVVYMQQGRRAYAFQTLEDLLKATLAALEAGAYAVDADHDTVSVADPDKARSIYRRFPLVYLEEGAVEAGALEAADPDDDDDDDDVDGEDMLAGLMQMLGLDPEALDPENATLEEMNELREVIPLTDWPEELQARYREVGGDLQALEGGDKVLEAEVVEKPALEEGKKDEA